MKRMICGILVIFMITALTGCGEKDSPKPKVNPPSLAVIAANNNNSQIFDYYSIEDDLKKVIRNEGDLTIINGDQSPDLVLSEYIGLGDQRIAKSKLERVITENAEKYIDTMETTVSNDEEMDILEALNLASRAVSNATGEKQVAIFSTGLNSTGPAKISQRVLDNPEEAVKELTESRNLPDLQSVKVYFVGLGDVNQPQEKLSNKNRAALIEFYTYLVEAAGGEINVNEVPSMPRKEKIDCPKVSPIKLDMALANLNNKVFFEPDLAVINEELTDMNIFDELAMQLNQKEILICGSVAGNVNNNKAVELSSERALKLKEYLVNRGLEQENMKTLGLGTHAPWRYDETEGEGSQKNNRSAVIYEQNTDIAKNLMKKYRI